MHIHRLGVCLALVVAAPACGSGPSSAVDQDGGHGADAGHDAHSGEDAARDARATGDTGSDAALEATTGEDVRAEASRGKDAAPEASRGKDATPDGRHHAETGTDAPEVDAPIDAGPPPVPPAALQGMFTTPGGPQTTLFASTTGTGTTCSQADPCLLSTAQTEVQSLAPSMTADLLVYLRGGTYTLTAPWTFGQADSGQNGHRVLYAAFPGERPLLSGGVAVAPSSWQLVDGSSQHFRAPLPAGTTFRNLYVNGLRALRGQTGSLSAGLAPVSGGYWTSDPTVAAWSNPTSVELVVFSSWQMYRCPVSSLAAQSGGTLITMSTDCWPDALSEAANSSGGEKGVPSPQWFENASQLTGAPGTFYVDPSTALLDYFARPGEDLATASVVYPQATELLSVAGTPDSKVHDIGFEGISLAYAAWTQASTPQGYVGLQAGIDGRTGLPPAAIDVEGGQGILFVAGELRHVGGMGLRLGPGCVDDQIVGNDVEDVSSVAIELGNFGGSDAHPSDPAAILDGNLVQDNFVNASGAEYFDADGILAGYTEHTTIAHNDLFGLPYAGISVGWGWGTVDPGAASSNASILNNVVGYPMRRLFDGGSVYTLGEQPGTIIRANYLHGQGTLYGSIYLDNGSQDITVSGNAVCDDPAWLFVQVNPTLATNNVVENNFTCADSVWDPGGIDPSNTVEGTVVDSSGLGSDPGAEAVVAGAGLEPAYAFLHPPNRAAGQPVTASSVWAADSVTYAAAMASDETATTGWSPAADDAMPWWQVDLGQPRAITRVEILARMGLDQGVTRQNFEVEASNDPSFGTYDTLGTQGGAPYPDQGVWWVEVPGTSSYEYVRIAKTVSEYFFLAEVRVLAQ